MRSIRLSLLVYFLLLVSASLGVATLLVYGIAQRTLRDKEEAALQLLDTTYEERCREAHHQLDERLLTHAKSLAGRTRPKYRNSRELPFQIHALGLLASHLGPNGHMVGPHLLWAAQGAYPRRRGWPPPMPNQLQFQLWHHDMITLELGQEVALPEDGGRPRISSRIETNGWSHPLPSRGELTLPSQADFLPAERLTWAFDDYTLPDGPPVRRVRFRSLINMNEGGGGGPPPPPRPTYQPPRPAIIIQCAANARELDDTLDGYREQRDEEREQLRAETAAALAFQRNWLLVIIAGTFAATILGSIGLVWIGLRPVQRLSDAVSKVSPKNFSLSLGDKPLPAELQPIAERLGETLDQLRRAFAREKQATADISHELRTPLAALLTTIELALRKNRSAEQYRELLQESHESAQHMQKIVERLLTLARLDAGVDRLRARSIDVAELAEQCVSAVRPLAEARGLHLSVQNECGDDEAATVSRVRTDPDKLREVLSNLLHNAIQYNRPKGSIDLVVGRQNGHVRLEVRDTGIGIAPESRERIFERFFRADPSRNSDGMNAGLGLAIVKEYIELMGGHIQVESAVGKGSTFRVELPMQAPTSAA